jgi:adenosine deaminase
LEEVGVERIDHGFSLVDDPSLVAWVAEQGTGVTACPTSNRRIGLIEHVAEHPLMRMREAGVLVTLNSDNAAMFEIDLADEYMNVRDAFRCSLEELEDFSLVAIEASWAEPDTKRMLRAEFLAEMDRLRAERGLPARGTAAPG